MEYKDWMDKQSYKHYTDCLATMSRYMKEYDILMMKLRIELEKRRGNDNTNINKQKEVLPAIPGTIEDSWETKSTDWERTGCFGGNTVRK